LPPTLIINDEFDLLRDEGKAYAHKLMEAVVQVTAVIYHGTMPYFVLLNALSDTPAGSGVIDQASNSSSVNMLFDIGV